MADSFNSDDFGPQPVSLAQVRRNLGRRSLVLVGLMGVGKTTIGRRLAAVLNMGFIDADAEIERASGMRIAEIFDEFGEAYFRDGERRVIARLVNGPAQVIATGGGAFMQDETRHLILDKALAVWLDADIDTLAQRVGRRDTRPLLRDGNPHEILTNLAKIRNPVYALAPVHVQSATAPHSHTVQEILKALQTCRT